MAGNSGHKKKKIKKAESSLTGSLTLNWVETEEGYHKVVPIASILGNIKLNY